MNLTLRDTLRELYNYRELLYIITWREVKIKYKQSVMGILWAVFMPMIIVLAGIIVRYAFSYISGKDLQLTEIATVSVKSVPWAFFVSSLRFGTNSLLANVNLVTKINFPKIIFPVASICSQLVDFVVASLVLLILLPLADIGLSIHILWVFPLIFILIALVLGIAILLSAANLFFRDVKYIVEVILTFAIFITPVFFEINMFGKYGKLLLINPVAPILEGINACIVLHQTPSLPWLSYSLMISLALLYASFKFFHKLQPLFAENI